jgi:ribosomal-protein-alanine N-acetyltransferase
VAKYVFPVETDLADTKEYIAEHMRNPLGKYAIVLKDIGKVIGLIEFFNWNVYERTAEIGYTLHSFYWRRGIVTEALQAMVQMAFEEVGVIELRAEHDIENIASGKVLEKCGFLVGDTEKKQDKVTRTIRKYKQYTMGKEEYKKFKQAQTDLEVVLIEGGESV